MAKNRDKSDILNIGLEDDTETLHNETALDVLLNIHTRLKSLLDQIEGDLISLGHTFDNDS